MIVAAAVLRSASDAALLARHVVDDPMAFSELTRRYDAALRRFFQRLIRDGEDVTDDLLQETYLRVHRYAHRFDPSRKFSSWLYTIAQHLAYNELRTRRRHGRVARWPQLVDGSGQRTDVEFPDERPESRPDLVLERREQLEAVERLIALLPEPYRRTFVLREVEDRTYEDVARILNVRLGTVRSRLSRARAMLETAAARAFLS